MEKSNEWLEKENATLNEQARHRKTDITQYYFYGKYKKLYFNEQRIRVVAKGCGGRGEMLTKGTNSVIEGVSSKK